jgi:Rieske Fe-S protein
MSVFEDISDLDTPGKYKIVHPNDSFTDLFLCRLESNSKSPEGAVVLEDGQFIVGFSRKCTHMSCFLVPQHSGTAGELPTKDGLLSCKCHSSCFDLTNHGLPVIGPATDCLASVELEAGNNPNEVKIVRWIQDKSVPYGVPYGGTSDKPNGD